VNSLAPNIDLKSSVKRKHHNIHKSAKKFGTKLSKLIGLNFMKACRHKKISQGQPKPFCKNKKKRISQLDLLQKLPSNDKKKIPQIGPN